MAIEKKLICCKTQANFDKLLEAGDILDYSIVFIKDTQRIWTHGTYFSSLAEMVEDISKKQDQLTAGENITIEEIDGVLTITSADTTYDISLDNNILSLTDSNGKTSTVDLSEYLDNTNTTYTISLSSGTITLTGSDGSTSTVSLADYETVAAAQESHDELQANIDTKQDKLTAGANVEITEDNVINVNIEPGDYETKEEAQATHTELQESIDAVAKDVEENYQPKGDYATKDEIPTKNSELENDSEYITEDALTPYETTEDATASHDELQSNIDQKQDKLTAGTGISIEDNVIACTLDTTVFKLVESLPTSDIDENVIYVVPSDNTGESNICIEYIYVNGAWEKLGEVQVETDLSDYYTKSEVDATTNALDERITTNETDIESNKEAIATNAGNIESLSSRTTANESSISTLQEIVSSVTDWEESEIKTVDDLRTDLTNLQTAVETNTSNIETNTAAIESNTSSIAELQENKQDQLTAGDNITIEASGDDLIIKSADTTYTLSLTNDTLTLTDSSGNTSTADLSKYTTDENTTYTLNLSSNTLTLTGSDGSTDTVDLSKYLDDTNTTYEISLASNILTLTGSDGNNTTVDLSQYSVDANTTYTLALTDNTLTLTGSDGEVNTIDLTKYTADENTTYSIQLASNTLTLTGSDGTSVDVDLSQYTANTTYSISLTDDTLTLTDSDGGTSTVDLSKYSADANTTYSIDLASNILSLIGSDGTTTTVDLSEYTTDTKNTAGATASTDKLYIIGATEQTENPETNTSGAYLEGTKVYDGEGEALATEASVEALSQTVEEIKNEIAGLTEVYCFMVRDYGDSDPTAKMFYGQQASIKNIGKYMKHAVVRGQNDFDFLAANRMTLSEDGKEIMLDGSDGDFMVATSTKIYIYAEKIEASDGTLEIFGLGLTPLTLFGKEAVGYDPFAMACDAAVYCQLTSSNTDHIATDDVRQQFHCIYNENIAGQYTAPTHNYYKETYKANGNGYSSGNYTTINAVIHAQNKNEDADTNYPYLGLYYRFVEIWQAAAKCELGTMDISALDLLGTGQTCAATPTASNWADEAITANSGINIVDADGNSLHITNIYSQNLEEEEGSSDDYPVFGLDGTTYACSLLPMLTPHRIIDKITANDNLGYINDINNVFDEDGNLHTDINLNTGEGMTPAQRYYVVRDCPGAESFSDGVMTGVVNCYVKMSFNDGVEYSDHGDLTGCYAIFKFSTLLYRGFTWSTGHWIWMEGFHYVIHAPEDGSSTYATAIYQRDPKKLPVITSSSSYQVLESVTSDWEQGYDVDTTQYGYNDGWRKNSNPSTSLFCYPDTGGAQHTYVCAYGWRNNGQNFSTAGYKRVNASGFGGSGHSSSAAASSLLGPYSVAGSGACYAGSFALLDITI